MDPLKNTITAQSLNQINALERSTKEYVILAMSLAAALGLLPFAVHRGLTNDWPILIFDLVSIVAMLSMFIYVYKTRKTTSAAHVLAFMFLCTEIITVAIKGPDQIIWCFPATAAIYYLVSIRAATIMNFAALCTIYLLIRNHTEGVQKGAFAISFISTNIFTIVFAVRNQVQKQQLEALTLKDPLTGMHNRRSFDNYLESVDQSSRDHKQPTSMIMLDIDLFKEVNDKHGHLAGDEALVDLTTLLRTQLHYEEKLYRIGGEEFVIAPIKMDVNLTNDFANRLRKIVEHSSLNEQLGITISLGIASFDPNKTAHDWYQNTDKALYKAKNRGRNQCQIAEH